MWITDRLTARAAGAALALALGLTLGGRPARGQAPLPDPDRAVLASGQTQGWRGDVSEPADGNGDDGDTVRGRLHGWPRLPPPPFADEAANLALDPSTGLMWVRDPALVFPSPARPGDDPGRNRAMIWELARQAVAALSYGGFDDWRLPNVHELQSLVDFGRTLPAWDGEVFPGRLEDLTSPYFWTGTTSPTQANEAYYVNFVDGHAHPWNKALAFSVRPVRDAGAEDPVLLLQTGQTVSYGGALPVDPPQGEDDGHLRRGRPPRYAFEDDGAVDSAAENLVTDLGSGLMWLRDPLLLDGRGGPSGPGGDQDLREPLSWQTAVERCRLLSYGGHDDWRLPSITELISISQFGRAEGAQDEAVFPRAVQGGGAVHDIDSRARWWSSTTSARAAGGGTRPQDEAWFITARPPISRHHVSARAQPPKAHPGLARCVRDAAPKAAPDGYLAEVRGAADWERLSVASGQPGVTRVGKFILAASDDGSLPLPAAFQETDRYPLHLDFLRAAFPERFGALTEADYAALAARRAGRRLWAGSLRAFPGEDGRPIYGFELYVDEANPAELPTEAEAAAVCGELGRHFRRRPLAYSPSLPAAVAAAAGWDLPGCGPPAYPRPAPAPGYTAYTPGEAYGSLRVLRVEDLASAELTWQDIVVLDRAPTDLEAVVGAVLTGTPQGELSHLAVRLARRGSPNAQLAGAAAILAPMDGQLVRLTVARDGYELRAGVDPAEAQAFWDRHRPPPIQVAPPDLTEERVLDIGQLAADPGPLLPRVGAKAANLVTLSRVLPHRHQVPAAAIPFHFYDRFLRENLIVDLDASPPVSRTLVAYLDALHADPRFQTDPAWRRARLARLRAAMRDGDSHIPDEAVGAIASTIARVFGPGRMVRLRSSSNAEDGLLFSGAGLYDSTSACVEDGLDGDGDGPSRCDPNQPEERTIRRGLRRVWASLWSDKAWAERAYYGVDQGRVAMAVLITPAFPDELAAGVAFTGNPLRPGAPEMVINVQPGDASVVLPEPGAVPERDVIEVEAGRPGRIRREQASSLMPPGARVLSDAQLRRLGEIMLQLRRDFPVDPQGRDPASILLDLEFKVRAGDQELVVKQIRPFLAAEPPGQEAAGFVRLTAPAALPLCSAWREAYDLREELADWVGLSLPAAALDLPLEDDADAPELWREPRLGPDAAAPAPTGPATIEVDAVPGRPELRSMALARDYAGEGRRLRIELGLPGLWSGEPNLRALDAPTLAVHPWLRATVDDRAPARLQPCGLPGMAEHRLALDLGPDGRLVLGLRYGPDLGLAPYTPAALHSAWLDLAGLEAGPRTVQEPSRLIYDAARHNWNEAFLVRLDPPVGGAHAIEVRAEGIPGRPGERFSARLLGASGEAGRELGVAAAGRTGARGGYRVWAPSLGKPGD